MKKYLILSLATSAIIFSSAAFAQEESIGGEGHPRINQVESRIERQENAVDQAEQTGKITAEQADKAESHLSKQKEQLKTDAAKHGGHITKKEQATLNHKLTNNKKVVAKKALANHAKRQHEAKKAAATTGSTAHEAPAAEGSVNN